MSSSSVCHVYRVLEVVVDRFRYTPYGRYGRTAHASALRLFCYLSQEKGATKEAPCLAFEGEKGSTNVVAGIGTAVECAQKRDAPLVSVVMGHGRDIFKGRESAGTPPFSDFRSFVCSHDTTTFPSRHLDPSPRADCTAARLERRQTGPPIIDSPSERPDAPDHAQPSASLDFGHFLCANPSHQGSHPKPPPPPPHLAHHHRPTRPLPSASPSVSTSLASLSEL